MTRLKWNGEQVSEEIRRLAGRGLEAALIHLVRRLKEVLSIAAPRKRVKSAKGVFYYRATTPALPGAPPRKLSGRLRASVTWEVAADKLSGRVGSNVIYAKVHERGNHPWLLKTLLAIQAELAVILGNPQSYSVSEPRSEAPGG